LASLLAELAQAPGTDFTTEAVRDRILQKAQASQESVLREERNRIAREIHDGVSQYLALLMLKMEIISRLADSDPDQVKDELRKVMAILESSVQELRRLVRAIRSPGLAGLQGEPEHPLQQP